jgi:AcrR family transcriptional regulator
MARRGSPTPNLREGRSTREAVLDVAERHFAERGFAGVSMREIAAEAGLRNQASLYNHFPSKQALYEAVLARGLEPIVALMVESRRRGAAGTDVERFVDRTLEYLAAHPDLPRLIQRAALEEGQDLRAVVSVLLRPAFAEGLTSLAASAAGHRPEELPYLALGLYHLIFGYFANTQLLELVGQRDPLGAAALARQRAFGKCAVTRLLARPSRLRVAARTQRKDTP